MPALSSPRALSALALTSLAISTQAQFVRAPTDLLEKTGGLGLRVRFKEVRAGIYETRNNVKSYSGFVDVGPDQHIYFQFFETRKGDAKKAPLSVWLEGGAGGNGMSGVEGVFQSVGPCRIGADGKVVDNPHAWTEAGSNLLFLDESVSTGFSFVEPVPAYVANEFGDITTLPSEKCPDYTKDKRCGTHSLPNIALVPRTTAQAAELFYKVLQGFVGAFPEYTQGGVNLASRESGGRFVPSYAKLLMDKNKEAKPDHKHVDLKSLVIGIGDNSAAMYTTAARDYLLKNPYGLAAPNATVLGEISNVLEGKDNCLDQIKACAAFPDSPVCNRALEYCSAVQSFIMDHTGRQVNDTRFLTPSPFPPVFHHDYLNTAAVQSALGVFTNYTAFGTLCDYALSLTGDFMKEQPWSEAIRALSDTGVTVALYAGDADMSSIVHPQVWDKIAAPGHAEAGFVNLTTSDGIAHGQVKQAGLLSFTNVYLSGSPVSFFQPLASLELFERAINGKDIATGKELVQSGSAYKTVGRPTSDTVHGNATVQFKVLPAGTTYNTTTNMPVVPAGDAKSVKEKPKADAKIVKRGSLLARTQS